MDSRTVCLVQLNLNYTSVSIYHRSIDFFLWISYYHIDYLDTYIGIPYDNFVWNMCCFVSHPIERSSQFIQPSRYWIRMDCNGNGISGTCSMAWFSETIPCIRTIGDTLCLHDIARNLMLLFI